MLLMLFFFSLPGLRALQSANATVYPRNARSLRLRMRAVSCISCPHHRRRWLSFLFRSLRRHGTGVGMGGGNLED